MRVPVNPDDIDDIAAAVAAIYREGELAVVRQVGRHLARYPGAPTARVGEPRLEALGQLRRAVGAIQTVLLAEGSRVIREGLARAWQLGSTSALSEIPNEWFARSGIGRDAERARRLVPQTGAIEALATAIVRDVGNVVSNILRDTLDAYRGAIAGGTARMLAGGQSRREATQAAWQRLVSDGVTGFTDRSGRRWRLSSYAEMAMRTASTRAAVQGQDDRLESLELDLVYISDHVQECPLCRPWEGKILHRVSGPTGPQQVEHATDDDVFITINVAGTVPGARAAGLWHPNCRHSMSAYLPGITRVPRGRPDPAGYDARMRQREIERRIRKWKEQEAAASTEEAKKRARKKVAAWQATMRKHLTDHPDLMRLRYREQPGAGSTPPRGQAPDAVTPIGPDVQPSLLDPSGDVRTSALPREERPLLATNPAPNPAPDAHQQQLQANAERRRREERARQLALQQQAALNRPTLDDLIPVDQTDAYDRERDIEQALRGALEQTYAGFEVSINDFDINEDEIQFKADITRNGTHVGTVERTFRRDFNGALLAEHDYLSLDRSARGQGFAEAWNAYLEVWYRQSGFERIEVHANIDVGGYTWARQGFDFEREGDANAQFNNLERQLARDELRLTQMAADDPDRADLQAGIDDANDLLDRHNNATFGDTDYPTAYELSQCGRRSHHTGRDAMWIGKQVLLGSDWQGVKWL